MIEAVTRGAGNTRNPFVGNVCQLYFLSGSDLTTTTVTRIAFNIYLSCRHTATAFQQAIGRGVELYVRSGDEVLSVANGAMCWHENADIAVMRLTFISGAMADCPYLPLVESVAGKHFNGFVVSYCGVSVIGEKTDARHFVRAVSIHEVERGGGTCISSIPGEHSKSGKEAIFAEVARCIEKNEALDRGFKDFVRNDELSFTFPSTDRVPSRRLMSVLAGGASGSPLVIKQDGVFRIMGMLITGGAQPKVIFDNRDGQGAEEVPQEDFGRVVHAHNFLDLVPYRDWINWAILKLQN